MSGDRRDRATAQLDEWIDRRRGDGADVEPQAPFAKVLTLTELMTLDIPKRYTLLDPLLRVRDLAMVYAIRGVGKTHFALGLAFAVATGGTFMKWRAPKAAGVLLIDGEMPLETLRRRLATIARAAPNAPEAEAIPLRILSADHQDDPLPSLATAAGRALVEPFLDDVKLVILDNVSTLFGSQAENDAEAWTPAQEWLLSLRRRGLAVVLIHHAGKGGAQRGTSRREDVLDVVIKLSRPADYSAKEGARFEVHFEKSRGLMGDAVESFEAELRVDPEGAALWTMKPLEGRRLDQAAELVREGATARDVAEALDVSRATAFRLIKGARDAGKLPKKKPGDEIN